MRPFDSSSRPMPRDLDDAPAAWRARDIGSLLTLVGASILAANRPGMSFGEAVGRGVIGGLDAHARLRERRQDALAGGWPGATAGAAIPPLLGAIARSGANALTSRQVRRVDEMIRKRSPLYQQRVANPPMVPISPEMRAALMRGLLLTGLSDDNAPAGYGLLSVP